MTDIDMFSLNRLRNTTTKYKHRHAVECCLSRKCLKARFARKTGLPLRLFLCLRWSLRLCFLEWVDLDFFMSDSSTFSFDRRLFFPVTSFLLKQSLSVKVSSQSQDISTFSCVCNGRMFLLVMIVEFVGTLWTQT